MKNRHVVSLALLVGTLCLLTGCEQSANRTPSDIVPAEEAEQCNRTVVFVADGSSPTEVRMAADFEPTVEWWYRSSRRRAGWVLDGRYLVT